MRNIGHFISGKIVKGTSGRFVWVSGFGDLNPRGPDSIRYYAKTETVISRWPFA